MRPPDLLRTVRTFLVVVLALGTAACSPAPQTEAGPARSSGESASPDTPSDSAAWVADANGTRQNPTRGVNDPARRDAPHVVLVAFDGFHHGYRGRHPTPNLDRLADRGLRAERMLPVFPSKTFPAFYTLATGLYAEHHGLVANTFRAPELGTTYRISKREAVEDGRFYRGEPIWVTAETQGLVAACFFWVGSEADVKGVRPSYWRRFDAAVPDTLRVDRVLEWLAMPDSTRPHLLTLYFEETDQVGHAFGPWSPAMARAVARVDALLGRLLDGLDALGRDDVYVLVTSDHGMQEFDSTDVVPVELARYPGLEMVNGGPFANLWVDRGGPGRLPGLRDSLQSEVGDRVDVYLRADVPERFHYSADPRIGDVVLIARGSAMVVPAEVAPELDRGSTHGWDNRQEAMGTIFFAAGPGIPAGTVVPPFESIHVYPFVATLLGLESPDVDGDPAVLGRWLEGGGRGSLASPTTRARPARSRLLLRLRSRRR